jgi:hypothetical protein
MRLALIVVGILSALLLGGRALADVPSPSDLVRAGEEPDVDDTELDTDLERDVERDVGDDLAPDMRRLIDLEDDESAIDDEPIRDPADAGAAFVEDSLAASSGLVDATALHDLAAREHRPSPWGRFDLAVAWRRIDRGSEPNEPSRRHEVLLVATWRN